MKNFKDYLTESTRTYSFRVRLADCDCTGELMDRIEQALSAFKLSDITKPKSMPIARCNEFYKLGPVGRHSFEITTMYPANPPQIQQEIHNATKVPLTHIYVTTPMADDQEAAFETPPEHTDSGKALLADPELKQDDDNAQDHVGLKKIDSFLKELEKTRGTMQQYTGVNDDILAKSETKEKAAKTTSDTAQNNRSPIGDAGAKQTNKKVKAL
jgi:hypothetical protein